jgi:hypothetical protein
VRLRLTRSSGTPHPRAKRRIDEQRSRKSKELRESCVALDYAAHFGAFLFSQFTSVDPAPAVALSSHSKLVSSRNTEPLPPNAISNLRGLLLDTSKPLFERYRAMFALRDIGSAEAVDALAAGLNDSSALFK